MRRRPLLHNGDHAPDFSLADMNGQPVSLREVLQEGHTVLLIFLRHLG